MMRSLLLSVLMCAVTVTYASAGESDYYNGKFNGAYVGLNLGYTKTNTNYSSAIPAGSNINAAAASAALALGYGSASSDSAAGGIQAGYNINKGMFLLGFEADMTFHYPSETERSGYSRYSTVSWISTDKLTTNWLLSVRPRLGLVLGDTLIYGTGGPIIADMQFERTWNWNGTDGCPSGVCHAGSNSSLQAGIVVGGGIEYAIDQHWSVKSEFLWADLGAIGFRSKSATFGLSQQIDHSVDVIIKTMRMGLNYRF